MNLADAIRKAAENSGISPQEPILVAQQPVTATPPETNSKVVELDIAEESSAHSEQGTVVRLELVLTPDQLQSLFRTVMNTQRSILTLREAATFLRLPSAVVERMAEAQEIPAFKVDGRWRFSRMGLQDWLSLPINERRSG